MTQQPLLTHEIGSLAKPSWRVKVLVGKELADSDLNDAKEWGKRLGIVNADELLHLLEKRTGFSEDEKQQVLAFSSLYATRFLEQTGLDLIWDGEQHRVEMYEYPVRRIKGFQFEGVVRSFDNKYYRKASCVETPQNTEFYHVDEYQRIARYTDREIKIPVTGAYTLVDWSYDGYYQKSVVPGQENIRNLRHTARKEFLSDLSKNVVYPNLKSLYEAGARYLQIDEPAATTKREEIELFVHSAKESIGDLAGKVFFSMHICFSDYTLLFPTINELNGFLNELHLEYANRDSRTLGTTAKERNGYEILKYLKDTNFIIGLGVLDIHTDFIESPELVRDRILYACDLVGDPNRIMVAPDCGLRTRTWDISYQKLCNLVEGRNLAAQALGI